MKNNILTINHMEILNPTFNALYDCKTNQISFKILVKDKLDETIITVDNIDKILYNNYVILKDMRVVNSYLLSKDNSYNFLLEEKEINNVDSI